MKGSQLSRQSGVLSRVNRSTGSDLYAIADGRPSIERAIALLAELARSTIGRRHKRLGRRLYSPLHEAR